MTAQLSRRSVLRSSLAVGGSLLAAGAVTSAGGCSSPGDRISFLNWQDYLEPTILADFTKSTGIVVGYETYESNDALAKRLSAASVTRKNGRKARSFDLIVPSENLFRQLRTGGQLQPLKDSIVTEALLANLEREVQATDFDPGNRYSVPWASGTTGIAYDTTVFSTPPTWDTFTQTEYAGKASMLREAREAFAAAAFATGADPNSTSAATIAASQKLLTEMARTVTFDSAGYLDKLASGKLVLAQAFSTDALQAAKTNRNLAFVVPPEGGTRWIDLLCIPADAPDPKSASRFIAYYLNPKVSALNATYNLVDTGNRTARQYVPDSVLTNAAIYPSTQTLATTVYLRDLGDTEKLYQQAWDQILATTKPA